MRKKGSLAEWDRVRWIAANMFDQNKTPAQIAACLGVAAQTVRQWRRLYRQGGRDALVSRKPPGRPPLLDEVQRQRLAERLEQGPAACGLDKYLWTTPLIAGLIEREFGVLYHHDHVGVLLRAMGFSHQKPARKARERDEAKIQAWRREVWPGLFKKARRPGA